ncbi:hypothetical protein QE152_g10405 [Popillia japonica]|uniref:Uncharacterized protein n=1 Tax=Popillia japonica TaxID=7064 RepID=A0AAW1LVL6_POPJA
MEVQFRGQFFPFHTNEELTEEELDALRAAILQEQEEQEIGGTDDDGASDEHVSFSENNTDSKQEAEECSDNENNQIDTCEQIIREPCFVGRDKEAIWRKYPITSNFAKHAQKMWLRYLQGKTTAEIVFTACNAI